MDKHKPNVEISPGIQSDIDRYLFEDLKDIGDITSDSLFTSEHALARIISKEKCVVAGLEEATQVFETTGAQLKDKVKDGDSVKEKTVVAQVEGPARSILKGERLALNFIGRMSGIATETKRLVDKCQAINSRVSITATRKTTPGFRRYEKKAVVLGGGEPHRYGLYDAVLIKDNHIKRVGSVREAIQRIQQRVHGKVIEVEVENQRDALEAADMRVDVIMLDNFDAKTGKEVAQKIKHIDDRILIEVSGGIHLGNIVDYVLFADRISLGYLTHSVHSKDFSLEII
jgi:nicotinate-nucleotide pyrophosphorylase (carboxylating)